MQFHILFSLLLVFLSFSSVSCSVCPSLSPLTLNGVSLALSPDCLSYSVLLNGQSWLSGGYTALHSQQRWFSSADHSLTLLSTSLSSSQLSQRWSIDSNLLMDTTFQLIEPQSPTDPRDNIVSIVFTQSFPNGIPDTANDILKVSTAFPAFELPIAQEGQSGSGSPYGFKEFGGAFLSYGGEGKLDESTPFHLNSGPTSGILLLFDEKVQWTSVLSPYSAFMAASASYWNTGKGEYGILGNASFIPPNFSQSWILTFGARGVSRTLAGWGTQLRQQYGRKEWDNSAADASVRHLGYNTDRGTVYWYNPLDQGNYEYTIEQIHSYLVNSSIPVSWLLLDSFWYYKDESTNWLTGERNWTAIHSEFPNGLRSLHQQTSYPFTAHARFYSPHTNYAKQNGGQYQFIIDQEAALPIEQRYWEDLLYNASLTGIDTLLHDWLWTNTILINQLQSNVTLGEMWLTQMNNGALKAGLSIQYCMPWTRHVLSSLALPAVTQLRSTDDHLPGGNSSFEIGDNCAVTHALGLACLKDNFWTSPKQPVANPKYPDWIEDGPAYEAAIATFSCGQVAPGDAIGNIDTALLLKSHRTGGLILKPDRPLFSLDAVFRGRSLHLPQSNAADGFAVHTFTQINSYRWDLVMTALLQQPFTFSASEIHITDPTWESILFLYYNDDPYWSTLPEPIYFNTSSSLTFPSGDKSNFTIAYFAPILFQQPRVAFLGEFDKWTVASAERMSSVQSDCKHIDDPQSCQITIQLMGDIDEVTRFAFSINEKLVVWKCAFLSTTVAKFQLNGSGQITSDICSQA